MNAQHWATWEWHGEIVLGVLVALIAHSAAARWTRAHHGETLSRAQRISFVSGLVVIVAASNGPLHQLADHYLFSAHMVQHLLLTLVVPPLLLAGLPRSLFVSHLTLSVVLRQLTRPVPAFVFYNATLVAWHVPLLYEQAMENHMIHIGQHLLFLGTALFLWWPVAGPRLGGEVMAPPTQLLYLFLAGIPMVLIAALVTLADEPLYRSYTGAPRLFDLSPMADQVAGGLIMWVPGSLVYLAAITVIYFRWVIDSDGADGPRTPESSRSAMFPRGDSGGSDGAA